MASIKNKLIAIYEKIYASDCVMNAVYRRNNKDYQLNIMASKETIEYILESNCSIARFGDGEFELILEPDLDLGFQTHDAKLAERLKGVLGNQNPNLLICIPYSLNDIGGRTEHSRKFWFHWGKNRDQHHRIVSLIRQLHPGGYCFGDAQITRPYIAYKTPEHGAQIFPKLKQLWDGKEILFVEGEKTRLGVGNDLFSNAKSVKRVICPATNAFDRYEEILKAVTEVWNGELILLALGPTATVLAADLAGRGMRAMDLGHVDIEYEWFLSGTKDHDKVAGKFSNEAVAGNQVSECDDPEYIKSIVRRVV